MIKTSEPNYVYVILERMTFIMVNVKNSHVREVPRSEWTDNLIEWVKNRKR